MSYRMFQDDQREGTGLDWVQCVCQRWLHEDCICEIEYDENGYCATNYYNNHMTVCVFEHFILRALSCNRGIKVVIFGSTGSSAQLVLWAGADNWHTQSNGVPIIRTR